MRKSIKEYFYQALKNNIDIDIAKDNLLDLVIEIADEVYCDEEV